MGGRFSWAERCAVVGLFALAACGGSEGEDVSARRCTTPLVVDQTFTVPQGEGDRSFQGHAHFDGEQVWLTYASAPAGGDSIQINALAFQCDGSLIHEPTKVSSDDSFTHTEPRITSSGSDVLLAWQRDDSSETNLSVRYRVFDRIDGPGDDPVRHLDTHSLGASAGNTWMPELAGSKAGFAIAGLRGLSDYQGFQAFVQRIDRDGEMEGEAINGELTDEMYQSDAVASMNDDGDMVLAWCRTELDETQHVVHAPILAGDSQPANQPVRATPDNGSQSFVGEDYLVYGRDLGGVGIKPAGVFNPDWPELSIGLSGAQALYPRVASHEGGGAVAWLEATSGFNAELHIQAFGDDASTLSASGSEKVIQTVNPAIGAYRLSIQHIQDQIFLLVWTEGPTSELAIKWRFVDLGSAT